MLCISLGLFMYPHFTVIEMKLRREKKWNEAVGFASMCLIVMLCRQHKAIKVS